MDVEVLAKRLQSAGFDLLQPFCTSWYNDLIGSQGLATDENHVGGKAFSLTPLPDYGRGDALALLIGNSKAMWPNMLRWLETRPDQANPVDTYTAETIREVISDFTAGTAHDIFWASDMSPERLVDMNRASHVSGLCYFASDLYLSIHPTFGSWVAFRAVVVLDAPATHLGDAPPQLPPLLNSEEEAAARAALAEACRASSEDGGSGMSPEVGRKFAAFRDCVSLGREHRYSPLQSEYHYTKDAAMLRQALETIEDA